MPRCYNNKAQKYMSGFKNVRLYTFWWYISTFRSNPHRPDKHLAQLSVSAPEVNLNICLRGWIIYIQHRNKYFKGMQYPFHYLSGVHLRYVQYTWHIEQPFVRYMVKFLCTIYAHAIMSRWLFQHAIYTCNTIMLTYN